MVIKRSYTNLSSGNCGMCCTVPGACLASRHVPYSYTSQSFVVSQIFGFLWDVALSSWKNFPCVFLVSSAIDEIVEETDEEEAEESAPSYYHSALC